MTQVMHESLKGERRGIEEGDNASAGEGTWVQQMRADAKEVKEEWECRGGQRRERLESMEGKKPQKGSRAKKRRSRSLGVRCSKARKMSRGPMLRRARAMEKVAAPRGGSQ